MKKRYLLTALCMALAVSTGSFARDLYDCPKGQVLDSYDPKGASCKDSCPKGLTAFHGRCVFCVNDKTGNAVDLGCTKNKPLCNSDQGFRGEKCVKKPTAATDDCPLGSLEGYTYGVDCLKCPKRSKYNKKNNECQSESVAGATAVQHGSIWNGKTLDFCFDSKTGAGQDEGCSADKPICGARGYENTGKKRSGSHCVKCMNDKKDDAIDSGCTKDKPFCAADQGKFGNECRSIKCKSNQYLANDKCMACPANAACDGQKATCKSGFSTTTSIKNGKVMCVTRHVSVDKQCKQGSHNSINWIKKQYKNCTDCKTENIAAGECSKNKKAHKHYSCMCDCDDVFLSAP